VAAGRWQGAADEFARQDASGGGVQRRRGSSGGQWCWTHDLTVSVQKWEGEGGLKWRQRWQMEGSHREATTTVALGREPERKRGSPTAGADEVDA
jgi:hypothetical protein